MTADNVLTTVNIVENKADKAVEFVTKYIFPDGGVRFFAARGSQHGGYTQEQWRDMADEIQARIITGSIEDIRKNVIAKLAELGIDVSTYARAT